MRGQLPRLGRSTGGSREGEVWPQVLVLPKHLDEKVARLHLDAVGVKLTTLSKQQAEHIRVDVSGPFKPNTYRS